MGNISLCMSMLIILFIQNIFPALSYFLRKIFLFAYFLYSSVFSYFLGNISFCIILLFILLLNTKYTPGLVVFFREIFLSAYFSLSSLASGYFGKKMVWQSAKTMLGKTFDFINSISHM